MRTRIKICGITCAEDARAAAQAGCDAIGLVFYDRSPRAIDAARALTVARAVPPFVTRVGLFMDADAEQVRQVMAHVPLDVLQFHGSEPPDYCESFGCTYLKAVPMAGPETPDAFMGRYVGAQGFLLDSHGAGQAGGTGQAFDWGRWPTGTQRSLVLAGGLHPDNVAEAVRQTRPWAVDVSSGVESSPGVKDARRMIRFISEVRRVDREQTPTDA
ncbi:MAG: phosphoribosylanthranilate isomerase [Pseudomonadota bacterium]|jgi:phosphoribosylanthranilate isomerase|uniref:phosphoribosylanthranilate isomerase n=1 Tax=unclassified Ectothiorhodospira TaxID=2684909 RepID=UPI001EE7D529|nr:MULTISPECIES: phosphoribosylanthranilate isomerase [unclassified Ectothiorhodospira]MCG5515825.1 phosphoribosylanthranilate isomerase [Ectothiorhodospira sp. 9100]MCG5518911.1 phosphoribosylanthranilate isomerase [Ectothiorhodospira sp. 9905]